MYSNVLENETQVYTARLSRNDMINHTHQGNRTTDGVQDHTLNNYGTGLTQKHEESSQPDVTNEL